LREAGLFAIAANLVAQQSPMKWFRWHLLSRKQKAHQATTHYTVHFCLRPYRKAARQSRRADGNGSNL
jgi:hypothetical protein